MQNNVHTNKQLQKQLSVVAMLPEVTFMPVFAYFCFGRGECILCHLCLKEERGSHGELFGPLEKEEKEQITAQGNHAH